MPNLTRVTNLNDAGPGSLRRAVEIAQPESAITFDAGLSGTIKLTSSDLTIAKNLTIRDPVARTISVSGSKSGHIVHVIKGYSATLSNLIFKDSKTERGFIFNDGTLILSNSTVSGNTGCSGISNDGTLTLNNSTVSGNSAPNCDAGGIYNRGTLTLSNSTVSGNSAPGRNFGDPIEGGPTGGIYNLDRLTLSNSTISGNSAPNGVGGILNGGTLTLSNSTVSGNSAPNGVGGGIFDTDTPSLGISSEGFGILNLSNSIISGNSASIGGGIFIQAQSGDDQRVIVQANLTFSTIYGNRATSGADIAIRVDYSFSHQSSQSYVKISNSIVVGDSAESVPDILGMLTSSGYNLFQDTSGATFDLSTATQHRTDKLLSANDLSRLFAIPVGLRNNDGPTEAYVLAPGSLAIDAIPLQYCELKVIFNSQSRMYTDQRGFPRPDGNEMACDIGAYEYVE